MDNLIEYDVELITSRKMKKRRHAIRNYLRNQKQMLREVVKFLNKYNDEHYQIPYTINITYKKRFVRTVERNMNYENDPWFSKDLTEENEQKLIDFHWIIDQQLRRLFKNITFIDGIAVWEIDYDASARYSIVETKVVRVELLTGSEGK